MGFFLFFCSDMADMCKNIFIHLYITSPFQENIYMKNLHDINKQLLKKYVVGEQIPTVIVITLC